LAVASHAEAPSGEQGAFNLAFLVERDRVPEFSTAVAALDGEVADRIELRYVGPLPPYSFADAEQMEGSAQWA
jgi:hypothetical protein